MVLPADSLMVAGRLSLPARSDHPSNRWGRDFPDQNATLGKDDPLILATDFLEGPVDETNKR